MAANEHKNLKDDNAEILVIATDIESEIAELSDLDEQLLFLNELGLRFGMDIKELMNVE